MPAERSLTSRPVLLVLAAMFAFSMMAVFTRAAAAPILGVAAWRAIFVAVVFAITAMLREGGTAALKPDATTLKLGAWLGLALAVASSTFVGGYAFTTVANTIFLHNLAPVMVFPLAFWLFKERSGPAAVTGAGIALFGVAMLSGVSLFQVSHFASSRFLLGDFLAFVSAIGYAGVLVLTRMTRRQETPILGTLFVAWTVAAVLLTVVAVVFGGFIVPPASLVWIFGLAIICTNIPFYLLNLGMKKVSAGMAAVLSLSEVLFATTLGLVVYGEQLAPIGWIGGALAGVGVLYAVTQRGDHDSAEAELDALLPVELRNSRLFRAGLGLVLLNLGAVCAMSGGWSVAPLVTLLGLCSLARFGPAAASSLLDGRFTSLTRWLGAALGALVVWSVVQAAGSMEPSSSLGFSLALIGVLALDRYCAAGEAADDRDTHPVFQLVLIMLALALFFGWIGHGLSALLTEVANLLLGLCGGIAVLSAVSGTGASARPGHGRIEAPVSKLLAYRHRWVVLLALWLGGGVSVVGIGHVGIVERFGAPVRQSQGAGLLFHFPPPIETITQIDVGASKHLVLGEQVLLTGDPSIISLSAVLRYGVNDAQAHAYGVSDAEAALVVMARAAMVQVVAHADQDALLTHGRAMIEAKVLAATQAAADIAGLGVSIDGVHLKRAGVPAPVVASFLDVISADEERKARINQAEAYSAGLIPRSRGLAVAKVLGAQGDSHRIRAKAVGYDVWFRSVARNGAPYRRLTRERIAAEMIEDRLGPLRLYVVPAGVRVWLDDEGLWPIDPNVLEVR